MPVIKTRPISRDSALSLSHLHIIRMHNGDLLKALQTHPCARHFLVASLRSARSEVLMRSSPCSGSSTMLSISPTSLSLFVSVGARLPSHTCYLQSNPPSYLCNSCAETRSSFRGDELCEGKHRVFGVSCI